MLALFEQAGFTDVERFYNAMLFGGWVARKAHPDDRHRLS
jgi:hypothetical protein